LSANPIGQKALKVKSYKVDNGTTDRLLIKRNFCRIDRCLRIQFYPTFQILPNNTIAIRRIIKTIIVRICIVEAVGWVKG
jgi:hypothetical protein